MPQNRDMTETHVIAPADYSTRFVYATVAAASADDACEAASHHYGLSASHADPTGWEGIWTVTLER